MKVEAEESLDEIAQLTQPCVKSSRPKRAVLALTSGSVLYRSAINSVNLQVYTSLLCYLTVRYRSAVQGNNWH